MEGVTRVDVVTSDTSAVPTAPDVVPRTKPSRSSLFETLWRQQLFVICQKPVFMMDMHYQSCTLNLLTVSVVQFTLKL